MGIGYQMDSLQAAIGSPRSMSRRSQRRNKKSTRGRHPNAKSLMSTSAFSSLGSGPLPQLNDHEAVPAYITNRMAMMQLQQQQQKQRSSTTSSARAAHYTYLPNVMWHLPIAGDTSFSNAIRPTTLCCGTGISGHEQYLQPDMLHVFDMFGSYFLGAGHLVRDNDQDNGKAKNSERRSAFWVETIDENDAEDESARGSSPNSSSYGDDDDSAESLDWSDPGHEQKYVIEKGIRDLSCDRVQMEDPAIPPDYEMKDA